MRLAPLFIAASLFVCHVFAEDEAPKNFPAVKMVPAFPKLTFDKPLWLTHAPDNSGRLFVIEQDGRIRVFKNDPDVAEAGLFLDMKEKIRKKDMEEGLLCFTFHPDYARNGKFFVFYAEDTPKRVVLMSYQVSKSNPNAADPESGKVILEHGKPYGNHDGGTLLFGRDRYLYLSIGDGGAANDPPGNAQNLGVLNGKIIRIDVNVEGKPYDIPKDNPFLGRAGARPEIYAYGLRNVWRMSFDRETGKLWAADVGQDKWEEVIIIEKGGNYGWNAREGFEPFVPKPKSPKPGAIPQVPEPYLDPLAVYPHTAGLSITGGYVYRGKKLPGYVGAYIYADYANGHIFAIREKDGKVLAQERILLQPKNISSFGEDQDGELFICCFEGLQGNTSKIYRLEQLGK